MRGYVTINVTLFLTNYILEVNFMKRILSLFAAFAVMLSLSACQPNDTGQDMQVLAVVEQANEMKTIESPEDGWTHEQLSEVMFLCGESFSLPCSLEDISDKFECGELKKVDDSYISVDGEKTSYYEMSLMYNEKLVGKACCYDDGNDKIVFAVQIRSMVVNKRLLEINGIYQETDFKRTTKALGVNIINKEDIAKFKYIYNIFNPKYPEEKIILTSTDEENILFFTYSLFDLKAYSDD